MRTARYAVNWEAIHLRSGAIRRFQNDTSGRS
jgi:hypothetical protein